MTQSSDVSRVSAQTVLRRTGAAMHLAWRAHRAAFVLSLVVTTATGLLTTLAAWLTKLLFDSVTSHADAGTITLRAGLLGLVGVVAGVLPIVGQYARSRVNRGVALLINDGLFRAVNSFDGLRHFESPAFHDRLRNAQNEGPNAPDHLVGSAMHLLQSTLAIGGLFVTLLVLSPPLALLSLVAAVPALMTELRAGTRRTQMLQTTTPMSRRQIFYATLLLDLVGIKEIRLFGLGDFLRNRMLHELRTINEIERRLERRELLRLAPWNLVNGLVILGGLVWAGRRASTGALSIGDLSIYLAAMTGVCMAAGAMVSGIAQLHEAALGFGHYLAIRETSSDLPAARDPRPMGPLTERIEFRDVWFRYTDDGPWVLQGLSFTIDRGTSLGIVGLNGAGKSTIVKLLCRFYDPDRGSVLWDGTDIRDVEVADLRSRIGAVFQDYMCYDLTVAENIWLGDVSRGHDHPRVAAAAHRAGISSKIDSMTRGYDTLLSRLFAVPEEELDGPGGTAAGSGAYLSGGQWQRLAIARGLMRADRDLLILDEPSAGLDPAAEQDIHERLRSLRAGTTTILISHRLSAVRRADRIMVVSDGRLAECGSHRELLSADGVYARLFRVQAAGYQDDADAPAEAVR